ncbi:MULTISPECIES: hypothetical protein [Streptosporangium]|uniref:Uncharacterized protein n=1 Tax=Streptosporangium brasiliense TaxID=47480 RepID=A0ABT9R481_9ACTN|nr:hypothetical protein [Streptosporangium brasiliense]MDP9864042.1 hypothetical protein [Streptosporangium brasiliense]
MTAHHLTFKVTRSRALDTGGDVWVALAVGAPGSVSGESLAELVEEVEAVKHFCLGLPEETPVSVEYVYELPGLPQEVLTSYRRERAQLDESARALAVRLREAGLSERDSATLLDMPASGTDLLRSPA